jgi:uncharacterized protein with GYD domain
MAKFLWRGSYSVEGVKGLLHEGGTKRRESVQRLVEGLGGSIEAFYFAFGEDDLFIIYDLPDNATAAAGSLIVGATGAVHGQTVVLLSIAEVDEAAKKKADYSPPQ